MEEGGAGGRLGEARRGSDTLLAVLEERRNPCDLDSIACLALSLTNRDLFRD